MKESEALHEIGRLFRAFPSSKATNENAIGYAEQCVGLTYPAALHDAVDALIRSEQWLPPVSMVLAEYSRHRSKYAPREVEQVTEITAEERALNIRKTRAMFAHLAGAGMEHGESIAECAHPDCVWLRGDAAGLADVR